MKDVPKLKRRPPAGRGVSQLAHHYRIERTIADRLHSASREERTAIYLTMYDELFREVPDHPRLTRRQDENESRRANSGKRALVTRYIDSSVVFAEFAPGDCRFVMDIAASVHHAYGIDISDQHAAMKPSPENFTLVIYDGVDLKDIADASVDLVFSDQLIEHLLPEDTVRHFTLVRRLLRVGGRYVFRTPHAFTGPHDISGYFSDEPEGFHLKEWTYSELRTLCAEAGFTSTLTHLPLKGRSIRVPFWCLFLLELLLGRMPHRIRRAAAYIPFRQIVMEAIK
jgi:hypothetical protein